MRASSVSGTERNATSCTGVFFVSFHAAAIAAWMRSARTGRLAGSPSLYFPAVTFPLHPEAYIWKTPGVSACRRLRAMPTKSAETPPLP